MAKDVTTASFDADVLASSKPVLVDFWAEWCGPCRMVSPILDEISVEYGDKIEVVKVNVDNEPGLAQQYGITGIPALQVFQDGKLVKSMVGAKPKAVLVKDLAEFLG
jgi:thioredoxin 1